MPFGRLHIGRYLNRRSRDVCIKSDVADKLLHRLSASYAHTSLGRNWKRKMNKIYLEKENIARIIVHLLGVISSILALFVIVIEHCGIGSFIIAVIFFLLFSFSIFVEFYECIFYDDSCFVIRSLSGIEKICYTDINYIKREFISHKTVRGGGHWRYSVLVQVKDSNQKTIIVPFPQFIDNSHLQELFTKIKSVNKLVKFINI